MVRARVQPLDRACPKPAPVPLGNTYHDDRYMPYRYLKSAIDTFEMLVCGQRHFLEELEANYRNLQNISNGHLHATSKWCTVTASSVYSERVHTETFPRSRLHLPFPREGTAQGKSPDGLVLARA